MYQSACCGQATLVGERIHGKGIVQQLELSATGVPIHEIEPFLGILVVGLAVAAVAPRPKVQQALGKLDVLQLAVGRLAFLSLASTITAEVITGKVRGRCACCAVFCTVLVYLAGDVTSC